MFGLLMVAAFAVYLLISTGVVAWSIHFAKKRGKNVKLWGLGAALIMYNLVFWDWIPTVVTHQYYCAKESGFWVYKTLEQWKAENPGVMEGLTSARVSPLTRKGDMENYTDTYLLNQRFNLVVKHNGQFPFNRWRHEQEVVDAKTGEVLARYVGFSSSQERRQAGWSGWKFWLDSRHCIDGAMNDARLAHFFIATKNLNEKGAMK
jgi:hypothetical protein